MMRHYHLYFLTVLLTQRIVASSLSSSFSSASSLAALNKITIVGGVHGNEYTGIWCVKCLEQQLQEQRRCDKEHEHEHEDRQQRTSSSSSNHENCYCYPSLQLSTLLANPTAFLTNQRFVDTDLNRQFSQELLESNNDNVRNTVEGTRALEIQQLLGPKCTTTISTTATSSSTRSSTPTRTDCIIDLHSTTANMGVTLMFPKGDVLMGQACAYAMHKFNNDNDDISSKNHDNDRNQNSCCPPKCRILLEGRTSRAQEPFLQSIAPHGLTIEVGPVPQGVIRHDAVQNTQRILGHILDYLQQRQRPQQEQQQQEQSKWKEHDYPDGFVPCFFYKAKIPWPSDSENPNFPAYLIHHTIQDQDYDKLIYKGDPLFVDRNGHNILYDGKHGSPVRLVFVNEGGYYYESSGTGIGVAISARYCLETGNVEVIEEEEKC